MDQINVQRWANSLRQFHRNHFKEHYTFHKTSKDEEHFNFRSDIQLSIDRSSNSIIPLSEHSDIDALSDAGTYIIEDDCDIQHDYELKHKSCSPAAIKQYRHLTKDLHELYAMDHLESSRKQTINRPIIDLNIPTNQFDLSSSPSSPTNSFRDENNHSISNDLENKSYNDLIYPSNVQCQQQSGTTSKTLIKPSEYFVISLKSETNTCPATNALGRKNLNSNTFKTEENVDCLKHNVMKTTNNQSSSFPSYENPIEKSPYYLSKRSSTIRPETNINEQTYSTTISNSSNNIESNFVRNTSFFDIDQRDLNSSTSTSKSGHKQIVLKTRSVGNSKQTVGVFSSSSSSTTTTTNTSSRQTNRTVQLRRARAKAKMTELSKSTIKQIRDINIMSTSYPNDTNSNYEKELRNVRPHAQMKARANIKPQLEDMLGIRIISSSVHDQVLSTTSPEQQETARLAYRKIRLSPETHREDNEEFSKNKYNFQEKRCELLRENGQQLAIKLVQLSSGILEKLKPNEPIIDDDTNVRQLERMVHELEMANRTLISINASLSNPTNTTDLFT